MSWVFWRWFAQSRATWRFTFAIPRVRTCNRNAATWRSRLRCPLECWNGVPRRNALSNEAIAHGCCCCESHLTVAPFVPIVSMFFVSTFRTGVFYPPQSVPPIPTHSGLSIESQCGRFGMCSAELRLFLSSLSVCKANFCNQFRFEFKRQFV